MSSVVIYHMTSNESATLTQQGVCGHLLHATHSVDLSHTLMRPPASIPVVIIASKSLQIC